MNMRQIKFRGKTFGGKWVYGSLLQFGIDVNEAEFHIYERVASPFFIWQHKVNPETVGEFTGLNDKNGKEIYEDDLVSFGGKAVFAVAYRRCCFVAEDTMVGAIIKHDFNKYKMDAEVIGNIYENPELLTEQNH